MYLQLQWALISEKIFMLDQKICKACWRMLSADDPLTTNTLSSTVSKVETPTHSTMDAEAMNTFDLCSISDIMALIATW